MAFIKESPASQLRKALGVGKVSSARDGAHSCGFGLGDVVARKDDPRHEADVLTIASHHVDVQWHESGWLEYGIFADDLVLVRRNPHRKDA